MSTELDGQTETESEDGGVALSKYGSDEMEIDDESAPTSTSQSPIQPFDDYTDASGASIHGQWTAAVNPVHPPLANASSVPMNVSLDEDLSGSLGTGSGHFEFANDEEDLDPDNPFHQPFGTHQVFPLPFAAALGAPTEDEEHAFSSISAEGTSHSSHQPLLEGSTINSQSLPTAVEHTELNIALPSLNDVFGSDFLSQSAPTAEAATTVYIDDFPADSGDDGEENMRNFRLDEFFNYWKQKYICGAADYPPISDLANNSSKVQRPKKITVDNLGADCGEYQGIHWSRFQTTKANARNVRRMTYRNHRNVVADNPYFGTQAYKANFHDNVIPNSDTYFCFQEMNARCRPYTAHFQLRHNLSASSKNAVFYSQRPSDNGEDGSSMVNKCGPKIMCLMPETDTVECAMDLTKLARKDASRLERVATLTASNGVLVAGGLEGVYAIKSLSTTFETKPITGVITTDLNCSTNHVETSLDRQSGLPQAIFCSNDQIIRTLDCLTNKFVRSHRFNYPVNCSATNPDGRLRLLVGDGLFPMLANAETGEAIATLREHHDFGFACAWAPDGITMATGHQDGLVHVWDARKLNHSLHTLPMEMAGCRAMAFSPLGSGKRVLVIAEPADFVHVVDGQTFRSKQEMEFFGEVSGISIPPDGSRLYIANCDPKYGGIMEFGRSWNRHDYSNAKDRRRRFRDYNEEQWDLMDEIMNQDYGESVMDKAAWDRKRQEFKVESGRTFDWLSDDDLEREGVTMASSVERARKEIGLRDLFV